MSGKTYRWTPENLARARKVLSQHTDMAEAVKACSRAVRFKVSRQSLNSALREHGLPSVVQHLKNPYDEHEQEQEKAEEAEKAPHSRFGNLVELVKRLTKRGGVTLEQLCDELEMSPKAAREYLADAAEVGITIDIAHEKLLFRSPEQGPSTPAVPVVPPGDGTEHRIGVFSDMHFGSKYCLREQLSAFVLHAYHDHGIRDFFCPGDIVEGCYRHAMFERSSESLDDQQAEFLDALPSLDGMRIYFIDGNHDYTFTERTGVEAGKNLVRLARERGRDDITFLGSRGSLIQYGDTRIELWHPKKGAAYALSYQLQNKIRDTAPERLPNILLTGHVHEYVKLLRSNVWAFYCGTFQHGDAPYGRSLGGDVAMGGLIIRWRVDPDGVVRTLSDEFVLAHHKPRVFDVAV